MSPQEDNGSSTGVVFQPHKLGRPAVDLSNRAFDILSHTSGFMVKLTENASCHYGPDAKRSPCSQTFLFQHPLMLPIYRLWAARSEVDWLRFPLLLSMPTMSSISVTVTSTPFPEAIQYSGDVVLYSQVLFTAEVVDRILGIGSSECVTLHLVPDVVLVTNCAKL